MKAQLKGIDVNLEISLKEYGFAWVETKDFYLFYYGIDVKENEYREPQYCAFSHAWFSKNIDVKKEFDWIENWSEFNLDTPVPFIIFDLYQAYGYENIFGSIYHISEYTSYQKVRFNANHIAYND